MELGRLAPGRGTADVPYGIPGRGRPVELPGQGMSGTSRDKDGDAGTFYTS